MNPFTRLQDLHDSNKITDQQKEDFETESAQLKTKLEVISTELDDARQEIQVNDLKVSPFTISYNIINAASQIFHHIDILEQHTQIKGN